MTKKTYATLAKDLGKHFKDRSLVTLTYNREVVDILCTHLLSDNPNFSPTRFRDVIEEARKED